MYKYTPTFYQYINQGAIQSAEGILPVIARHYNVKSVVDFGCGQGAWMCVWKQLGVGDILGLDGQYVIKDALLISPEEFKPCDLSQPIDLGRSFDLVQSLEVAEHLPEESADTFVDNLVRHGKVILFSAAVRGQGGENHLNEQPYEYWRDKFLKRGFVLLDAIRPVVKGNQRIEPWYRYNTLLYVDSAFVDSLPAALTQHKVGDGDSIVDVSPLWYRARKRIIGVLPLKFRTWLAVTNSRIAIRRQRPEM